MEGYHGARDNQAAKEVSDHGEAIATDAIKEENNTIRFSMRVTVITPCSRPEDLPRLVQIYRAQDYQDKELSILMDFKEHTHMSIDDNVWQWGADRAMTIGAKRNELCKLAKGDIILHMDSDDYYAPDFITRSVNHLLSTGAMITGLSSAYFFKPGNLWYYEYKGKQPYVIGSGMCYYRKVWEKKPFEDKNSGEDLLFQANAGKVIPHQYIDGFMAMIHDKNTASHKQLSQMKRVNPEIAESILGESYYLYV